MQTQAKEVKATSFPTQVIPDEGYYLTSVKVNAPDNLAAGNIKKDVTIAGVTGTFEGTTPTPTQTKEVKATSFPTVVSPDSGYALSQATVTAPDNLTAENIKSGVSIAGVTGTYEGSGSGQLDDRAKFWMRGIQNRGRRYDAEGNFIPFVMLKEYWPDKLQGYEITSDYGQVPLLALTNYCCAYFELMTLELPEGKGKDGVTHIPDYAFFYAGMARTINGKTTRMTVTGGDTETYSFGHNVFQYAQLTDVPDINYEQNKLPTSLFYGASFNTCNVPEGIVKIESSTFQDIKVDDNKITLPTTLTTITGFYAITGTYNKKINIVMKSTTPPTMDNSSGFNSIESIIVPAGTLEAYQTATNWSAFADIMVEATAEAGA